MEMVFYYIVLNLPKPHTKMPSNLRHLESPFIDPGDKKISVSNEQPDEIFHVPDELLPCTP